MVIKITYKTAKEYTEVLINYQNKKNKSNRVLFQIMKCVEHKWQCWWYDINGPHRFRQQNAQELHYLKGIKKKRKVFFVIKGNEIYCT